MAKFRINYNQVVGKANEINNMSLSLDKDIIKLENLFDDVKKSWQGPASKEFQDRLRILIAEIKETKFKMSSVSSTIKNVAYRIQKEDERQAEMIEKLSSGGGGKGAFGYSDIKGGGVGGGGGGGGGSW